MFEVLGWHAFSFQNSMPTSTLNPENLEPSGTVQSCFVPKRTWLWSFRSLGRRQTPWPPFATPRRQVGPIFRFEHSYIYIYNPTSNAQTHTHTHTSLPRFRK